MWVLFDKIFFSLFMVVIVLEDNCFVFYNGFDMIEIKKVMKENEIWKKKWGVSIIS